jgi:hypothetical protein
MEEGKMENSRMKLGILEDLNLNNKGGMRRSS